MLKELVGELVLDGAGYLAALDEGNIKITIVINVQQCRPARYGFRKQITVGDRRLVAKRQSPLLGDLLEPRLPGRRIGSRASGLSTGLFLAPR